MSKATLLEKLTSKEYRDAFISDEIDVGIPMQLREMRESRGWKQAEVAKKIGTGQPRFPVMEKPGHGNFSLKTLKKLASVFDVGLIVSFVPFSEMIDFRESISHKRLVVPGFCDEYANLANRYARQEGKNHESTAQFALNFSAGTTTTNFGQADSTRTVVSEAQGTRLAANFTEIPLPYIVQQPEEIAHVPA